MMTTLNLLKILQLFLKNPDRKHRGIDVKNGTGLATGSVYRDLDRLTEAGWLKCGRDPMPEGGKASEYARRWWKITRKGQTETKTMINEVKEVLGLG